MSTTRDLLVTAVAALLLLASMGAVWGIDQYRTEQRLAAQQSELVASHYETPANATQYRIVVVEATEPDRPTAALPPSPTGSPTSTPARRNASGNASGGSGTATATPAPTTPTPAPDYDGDGIPDASDTCPTRPERVNGFRDGDGCPDIVKTSTGAS